MITASYSDIISKAKVPSAIQNFPYPNIEIVKMEGGESVSANWFRTDAQWRETLAVELVEGRDFSAQLSSDLAGASMINETMTKALGLNDPIGSTLNTVEHSYQVIGVVKDFFYAPLSLLLMDEWLKGFAYRVQVKWYWLFASAAIGISISLLTVNYHNFKVARTNPAKSLRNE